MKKKNSLIKRALQLGGLYLLKKRMDRKETERAEKLALQAKENTPARKKLMAKVPLPELLLYTVLAGRSMKADKAGKKKGISRQGKSAVKNAKTAGIRHSKNAALSGGSSTKKKIVKNVARAVVRKAAKKKH